MTGFAIRLIIVLAAVFSASGIFAQNIDSPLYREGWKLYPSFDKQVINIIDGERYTYYLVHSQLYSTSVAGNNTPYPVIYCQDKYAPGSEIKALFEMFPTSSTLVTGASYDPVGKYLFVINYDNSIDIVYDNGTVLTVNNYKEINVPGFVRPNAISFDVNGQFAMIATDFGYLKVDTKNGRLMALKNFSTKFDDIATVGDRVFAISDGKLLATAPGAAATNMEAFSEVVVNAADANAYVISGGKFVTPQRILPLTDNTVAIIGHDNTASASVYSVNTLTLSGEDLAYKYLTRVSFKLIPATEFVMSRWECNATPNRDGFYLHDNNTGFQLNRTNASWTTISKTAETTQFSGTWDFKTFSFYKVREGFYTRTADGVGSNAVWSDPTTKINPSCAISFKSDIIRYSPKYGFIMTNEGPTWRNTNYGANIPVLLCGLNNGKWSNYSPAYNIPEYIENNPTLLSKYQSTYADSYPLKKPKGVTIDPLHPDYVYVSSSLDGIARFNLSNPKETPLHMSRPNHTYKDWDGFVSAFPQQSASSSLCCVSTVDFDADGNMFASYFDLDKTGGTGHKIYGWDNNDVSASLYANSNPASFKELTLLGQTGMDSGSRYHLTIALKHPSNKNIVISSQNSYALELVIYNTQGSIKNLTDDIYTRVSEFSDGNDIINTVYTYRLCEDFLTGNVFVLFNRGVYYFCPSDLLNGQHNVSRLRSTSGALLLENISVYDMCRDEEDNMWFATASGIYCLNPELDTVIAHYTKADSPLPTNSVYALCWNPAEKSILASTDLGYVEFFPSEAGVSSSESHIKIYPQVVKPEWHGWISLSGADSEEINVLDASGKEVASLGTPINGKVYWSSHGKDKHRIGTGRYTFHGTKTNTNYGEIIILK